MKTNSILFFTILFVLMAVPVWHAQAANIGDIVNFNVDGTLDATGRTQVPATLVQIDPKLYVYVENNSWNTQTQAQQDTVLSELSSLSDEFSNRIYPILTSTYGSDLPDNATGDTHITILFESINSDLGGYVRTDDEYSNLQIPDSNQREMIYLPVDQIGSANLKVFLAHEFVHLIVFNQKNRIEGSQEEVWLSEARSDYASTLLGYDDVYQGSNLQRRVEDFLEEPNDSLTEWLSTKYDYAVEDVFTHYLVDHYGIKILVDSLHSPLVGIPSLNQALLEDGAKENFSQIFTDWTITLVVNDCSQNPNYCYLNPNLKSLNISPNLIFLPLEGNSSLSSTNFTKNWSGNWQKIIGGSGDLTLDFSGGAGTNFVVPYIIYDKNNNYTVKFLTLDSNGKGEIDITDFGDNDSSLILIPTLQSKLVGFDGPELTYPYTFTVSVSGDAPAQESATQKLLDEIASLQQQIAALQSGSSTTSTCSAITNNLYIGLANNSQVSCLQSFLKSQGSTIYPQGLVTGNFGSLTKAAVIAFQKKYNILQTGFVGVLTRQEINTLLQANG